MVAGALVIAGTVLWIFWPALHGAWLWDDGLLIVNNALIHDPAGLWKIWLVPSRLIDYVPITASVEWLEWHLWRANTFGYHLVSVGLHIASALLVWRLLAKLGLRWAWVGGLLFAVHPVVVESVAWIAELKNTLSLPPFLLAMCAWIDYDARGRWTDYALALGLFLVAMLCKATMVMFPVVLLLYAWWRRGRVGVRDLYAGAPFFAVSLVLGVETVWFLRRAMGTDTVILGGALSRVACAGVALAFYAFKSVLPVGLLPIYPKWTVDPPSPPQFLPWVALGAVVYVCWLHRTSWGRHALLGLGFFVLSLAPFLGFTAGSYMEFTWVMDHLLYIAVIGWIGLVAAGLGWLDARAPSALRPSGIALVAVAVALLTASSRAYAGLYANSESLWTYTVERNPDAWTAHNNLGQAFMADGRTSDAIAQFTDALLENPDDGAARNNLGVAFLAYGRVADARVQIEAALRLEPRNAEADNNLSIVDLRLGRVADAVADAEEAIRINPTYPEAYFNLGLALAHAGRPLDAIREYEVAVQIAPTFATAYNNIGVLLVSLHRVPEAIPAFQAALRADPHNVDAQHNLMILENRQHAAPSPP